MNAPNSYFRFVEVLSSARVGEGNSVASVSARELERAVEREVTAPAESAPSAQRFRVRVSQTSGPRSRILTVEGASEDAARRAALAQVGRGWKVLHVDSD